MILNGLNARQVSDKLRLSVHQVRQWQTRGKWVASRTAVEAQVTAIVKSQAVKDLIRERTAASVRVRRKLSQAVEQHADVIAEQVADYAALPNTKEGQGLAAVLKTTTETAAILHGWGKEGPEGGMVGYGDLDSLVDAVDGRPVIDVESVSAKEIVDQSVKKVD